MKRLLLVALGLSLPGVAYAWPPHQLFAEADLLWTFGGHGHLGVGVGVHYSVLPLGSGPDVGVFGDLRWTRFHALASTFGTRLGAASASTGNGGYETMAGANVEAGWTVRTNGPSGLRVGAGATLLFGQLRVDGLVWTPHPPPGPTPGPDGALPLASWAGDGDRDVTLSLGAQVGLIPQYYLLAFETDTPPPDSPTGSPIAP